MFPRACFNTDGRLRVKNVTVPVDAAYNLGVPCGPDFVYADFNSPQSYQNGLPMVGTTAANRRLSAITGTFRSYQNGLPFALNGALLIDTSGSPPDHYQNGLGFIGNALAVEVVT